MDIKHDDTTERPSIPCCLGQTISLPAGPPSRAESSLAEIVEYACVSLTYLLVTIGYRGKFSALKLVTTGSLLSITAILPFPVLEVSMSVLKRVRSRSNSQAGRSPAFLTSSACGFSPTNNVAGFRLKTDAAAASRPGPGEKPVL